jgi:hypothetical protein
LCHEEAKKQRKIGFVRAASFDLATNYTNKHEEFLGFARADRIELDRITKSKGICSGWSKKTAVSRFAPVEKSKG